MKPETIRELVDAAEEMLSYEQSGGDGWWDAWEKIKAALAKARAELSPLNEGGDQ